MGFQFSRRLTIEWGHCDPAGIVFNPRFFEFFDWSTALLVRAALGLDKAEMLAVYGLAGIPLVDVRATFHHASHYGEEVEIVSRVISVGRSSFEIEHRLFNDARLAVEGREKRVWAVRDAESGGRLKAEAMPDEVARKLKGGSTPP
ncbi:MAG: acyl-CoA thioesterase [Roseiarcus sp.]